MQFAGRSGRSTWTCLCADGRWCASAAPATSSWSSRTWTARHSAVSVHPNTAVYVAVLRHTAPTPAVHACCALTVLQPTADTCAAPLCSCFATPDLHANCAPLQSSSVHPWCLGGCFLHVRCMLLHVVRRNLSGFMSVWPWTPLQPEDAQCVC